MNFLIKIIEIKNFCMSLLWGIFFIKNNTETDQYPNLLSERNAKIPENTVENQCQSVETKNHNQAIWTVRLGLLIHPAEGK